MRPPAQFAAYEARYQHLVYDLLPRGKHALAERGTLSPYSARRYDPFIHQLMAACVTSSVELGAPALDIRFISKDHILLRPTCPQETRESSNPLAIPIGARTVVPDGLFGLEYKGQGFRFFALEVDRNTESICSRTSVATTFAKKIEDYRAVLRDRLYRTHWGLPNLSILTVTTNASHALKVIKHLRELDERAYEDRFLFHCEADFGANWRVPKTLLSGLLQDPWNRVGPPMEIDKP